MPIRQPISDLVNSMLQQESGNICPLCGKFERTGQEFTNHHINHDPSQSVYWNLIKICQTCHDDLTKNKTDNVRFKRVKQVKKNLFRRYFGAEAYKALLLAYKHKLVTTTPVTALELMQYGYFAMSAQNVFTVGPATNTSTFDTYAITSAGNDIVEKLELAENNAH